MKPFIYLLLPMFVFSLSSCREEKKDFVKVTVIRDCTGTYLRWNNKDYHVCNLEKSASFADGASAMASFKKIGACTGSANDQIVCYMLHANEGWIEVEDIR